MEKEKIKLIIKEWILRIDKAERLPDNIIALNFGLYEPYGIELVGCSNYTSNDDDWACEEAFEPSERNCPPLDIDESEHWEQVLALMRSILKELIIELSGLSILNVTYITTGFSDGDLYIVK